ncbi:hypothetical protein [Spirosoma validum]|uniref:Dystroglycan-type cadherin-like domain-containing protein n=1 Tax=Spirosoma validum TaxID=2771355 RepID=A0A927B1P5_9BACT|nr:hypothetical protein [Spirosoma validum]MBD2753793.1 hypothetical protein [Spirosoma validum]
MTENVQMSAVDVQVFANVNGEMKMISLAEALKLAGIVVGEQPRENRAPLPINPCQMPEATVGVSYTATLMGTIDPDGDEIRYVVTLPDGLTANGLDVSGKPTKAGGYAIAYQAIDSKGAKTDLSALLLIKEAPVDTTIKLAGEPRTYVGTRNGKPLYTGKGLPYYLHVIIPQSATQNEVVVRRGINLAFDLAPGAKRLTEGIETGWQGMDEPMIDGKVVPFVSGYRRDYFDSDDHRIYWTPGTEPDRIYTPPTTEPKPTDPVIPTPEPEKPSDKPSDIKFPQGKILGYVKTDIA